jgi:hypothetical protein
MSDVPREFPFARHPARQGFTWLATAYRMFKVYRLAWVALLLAYFILLLLMQAVPFIGPYAAALLSPVFGVGLLAAAWTQERGGRPAFSQLFQGFRTNLWSLLAIGVFFVAAVTLVAFAASLVDGGKLRELMVNSKDMTEAQIAGALSDPQLQLGVAFSALFSLSVMIVTWWTQALVVFQDAGFGAGLAASLRAVLANWKALAFYGVGIFFYAGVVPGLLTAIVAVVVPLPAAQLLVIALLLPYSLFFAATLYISFYVSYRDVFHAGETLAPLAAAAQG